MSRKDLEEVQLGGVYTQEVDWSSEGISEEPTEEGSYGGGWSERDEMVLSSRDSEESMSWEPESLIPTGLSTEPSDDGTVPESSPVEFQGAGLCNIGESGTWTFSSKPGYGWEKSRNEKDAN